MTTFSLTPVGYIQTCFPEKFGIPRQAQLAPGATAQLTLDKPFNNPECVEGLEHCSHLWLYFIFHEHVNRPWKPKVRPPRFGGNKKLGVFATRSSFRPNHLGQSVVTLDSINITNDQVTLHLSGIDLLNGTPIVDIKPYAPYADSIPYASNTLANTPPEHLPVTLSLEAEQFITQYEQNTQRDLRQLIIEVLQQNPQPAYQSKNTDRVYGISLYDCNIRWKITNKEKQTIIEVLSIKLL